MVIGIAAGTIAGIRVYPLRQCQICPSAHTSRNGKVRMATVHPPDHLLIATGFIRQALPVLEAAAILTRILEFNPIQEETPPSRMHNRRRVRALLDTARAFKTTVLSQELPGTIL